MTTRAPTPLLRAVTIWLLSITPILRAADAADAIALPPVTVTATKPGPSGGNLEICPAWTIIVLDEKGLPVSGLTVSQTWQYYGIDKNNDPAERDQQVTDAQGKVSFPARLTSVNPLKFVAARAAHAVSLNVHESFGPTADFNVGSPAGYKRAASVGLEGSEVWPDDSKPDSHGKTVKGKTGFTTTLTLQRLDLFDAVNKLDVAAARQFLAGDPSSAKMPAGSSGNTPLHELMMDRAWPKPANPEGLAMELAGLLLAAGADINARNGEGKTPLHLAAGRKAADMTEFLLGKGAEANALTNDRSTPLHLAASRGAVEIMAVLLAKGADAKAVTASLSTPLHSVVHPAGGGLARDVSKPMDLLLQHGADVNAKDRDGNTPLHWAAEHTFRPEIVRALLERGADSTARNTKGETPLDFTKHYNATAGTPETRELLTHPPPNKTVKPTAETKPASTPPATTATAPAR